MNSLRDRIATALRDDLRTRTMPIPGPGGGMGLTEYDLADSVLPVVQAEAQKAEQLLTAAYRERAHLVAFLATLYPAVIIIDGDPNAPGWALVYVDSPTGQLSWHLANRDLDLFPHVTRVDTSAVIWDNHTTDEKYGRIRQLTADLAKFPLPPIERDALRESEMQADEQRATAELALALLHEGEQQPPADEGVVLSPAQMIWRWNRATPERRLEVATAIRNGSDTIERYERALRRIAERCESRRNAGNCTSDCHSEVARTALTRPEPTRG